MLVDDGHLPSWLHPAITSTAKLPAEPTQMAVCQNLVPLVNIKIAGKWMFIPLKMVLIGNDPYPDVFKILMEATHFAKHGLHTLDPSTNQFFFEKPGKVCQTLASSAKMNS